MGKGFTEWTNVAKAKPLFKGHYQPHLPADLGFYDLRVPEVRQAQADLAREFGIYGFCYYHYWFNGKRLLERPFYEVLHSGKPDFPFCLCWANENWTRTWDGQENNILIKQEYSENDFTNHIQSLIPVFSDKRYIHYEGKPIFLVYRASNLPDPQKMVRIWREEYFKTTQRELFLCKVESLSRDQKDPVLDGFDASVEFQPDWKLFQNPLRRGYLWKLLSKLGLSPNIFQNSNVLPYDTLVKRALKKSRPDWLRFRCITPGWDNTSRKSKKCHILTQTSPEKYEYWLTEIIKQNILENHFEDLIFINAWNEWGEGNHLEPDLLHGHAYLEATRKAIVNSIDGLPVISN